MLARLSGVRRGVIRALGRTAAGADAGSVLPRLDVATGPHSAASALRAALSLAVSPLGVARPIQGKAIANQPFAEIRRVRAAARDDSSIAIDILRCAVNRAVADERTQFVRRRGATAIGEAIVTSTKLIVFRRVDAPQANPCPMYFQRVAVDHAGLARQILGTG